MAILMSDMTQQGGVKDTKLSLHENSRIAEVWEYDYSSVRKKIKQLVSIANAYNDMQIVEKMKEIVLEYISNNYVLQKLYQ